MPHFIVVEIEAPVVLSTLLPDDDEGVELPAPDWRRMLLNIDYIAAIEETPAGHVLLHVPQLFDEEPLRIRETPDELTALLQPFVGNMPGIDHSKAP